MKLSKPLKNKVNKNNRLTLQKNYWRSAYYNTKPSFWQLVHWKHMKKQKTKTIKI